MSLACQAHVDVSRTTRLCGPVSLFALTIANSGERKSTCDGFFAKAIRHHQEAAELATAPLLEEYETAKGTWEAKRQGVKEKIRQLARNGQPTEEAETTLRDLESNKPQPPKIPRLFYGDATPEALAHGLANKWPTAAVQSAEAGTVFGSHAMNKDSVMRNLAQLNQLWDGAELTVDRRTSESFKVRGARLTLGLMTQEETLREFLLQSGPLARGSGFLARFLISWPESTQGNRKFKDEPDHWPALARFHKRIGTIMEQPLAMDEGGALTPTMMLLSPEAKAAWVGYHDAIEVELARGGDLYDVRDVASKSADNAARMAALFQFFEDSGEEISADNFKRASQITAWHLNESRRFFGEIALAPELSDAVRLDNWLIEQTSEVSTREAQQFGPVRDKRRLDAAIVELAYLDRARLVKEGKRRLIQINPALLGGQVAGSTLGAKIANGVASSTWKPKEVEAF